MQKIEKIEHKEIDQVGLETLDVISDADKFNRWMYDTISPHCSGNILEIGSGVGNISQFFLNESKSITLSDIRENYCNHLHEKFSKKESLNEILLMDLTDPDFDKKFKKYFNSFDSVFALNVIEHIYDDKLAMANIHKLLKKGGKAVILVPSYQSLYNGIDKSLDHYRRYTKKTLSKIFTDNQFKIDKKQYFNFMGIFAWFISGKLQKNDSIPNNQMKLYNFFVPIFKIIDVLTLKLFGLSTIIVGHK